MSEFKPHPLVSTGSMIGTLRNVIADHKDLQGARNRLRNMSIGAHAMEQEHLMAILEKLYAIQIEERTKANSPPRAE